MKKFFYCFLLLFFILISVSWAQILEEAPYYKMVTWDSSPYKSYRVTGGTANPNYNMTFRLLYPKNYDGSSVSTTKYPLVVMLHGKGESAIGNAQFGVYPSGDPRRYNNDHQLYHQGREYLNAVNSGKWPGFVLFPQNAYGDWLSGTATLADVVEIIQTISKTLKIDENRIFVTGLSAGAHAMWASLARYPTLYAGGLAYSGITPPTADNTTKVAHMPIWYFQGEVDKNPDKTIADRTIQAIRNVGGTPTYTVFPETGHGTWNKAIAEPDFFPFLRRYSKLSIHPYFGKTEFDQGEAVNVKLGITPGFQGYEWRRNGVLISGATSNEIIATSLGSYTVRFKRGTVWTEWSSPCVLKLKTPPAITKQPVAIVKTAGSSATFSVTVSGTAPFTYQWQRNGVNIPNSNSGTFTIPNCLTSDAGDYRVVVTNALGTVTSNTARLSVSSALAAAIHSPVSGTFFTGGQTIAYSGDGNDSKGIILPASAISWKLEFRKPNGTITVQWTRTGSKSGSFVVPTTGIGNNDYYRLTLTVKDPATAATKSLYRDIRPKTTEIGLVTQPAGLKVVLDGRSITTPYYFFGVEGMERTIRATSPQTLSNQNYYFSKWSDGGTATHTIIVPANDIAYTATFTDGSTVPVEESNITASIDAPVEGTFYKGGETINDSGSGKDAAGATFGAGAFTWKLEFHKPTGISSLWTKSGVTSGSFTIPTRGETSPDVFYRLILTVKDASGNSSTIHRDIHPYTSVVTLSTHPSGLQVLLDSKPYTAPHSFEAVEGRIRSIGVVASQTWNGQKYSFSHWAHGGNAAQDITISANDAAYTAVFVTEANNPVPTIDTPTEGTQYRGGATINYSGSGKDREGVLLGAEAFTWELEFHKPGKVVYVWTRTGSKSGSFTIPVSGETSPDVFYRLILTVNDDSGRTGTVARDIPPYTSMVTLATQPAGLQVTLDSKPVVASHAFEAVEGRRRSIGIVNGQTLNGKTYTFSHWLHGGNASQTITVPADDVTYTAVYVESSTSARIAGNGEEDGLSVYPNPSVEYVTVNIKAVKGEKLTIALFNKTGMQVKSLNVIAKKEGVNAFDIDLNDIGKSSYVIKIQQGRSVYFKHLIKE